MFATVGKLLAVSTATLSLLATPFFGPAANPFLTQDSEKVVAQSTVSIAAEDSEDVVEISPFSPYAIMPKDENSFDKIVTMTAQEVADLTEDEQAKLQDTKVLLSDGNADEYVTFEKTGSDSPAFGARISEKPCAGRHDFYRLVNTSGTNYCFANAGTKSFSRDKIKGHCPGANQGKFTYHYFTAGGYRYDGETSYRGPLPSSKYSTCYWLNNGTYATSDKVIIK